MTPREAANIIYDRICGTPEDIMAGIDILIEEGDIDQEFFRVNELAILDIVDSNMFNCAICGWNYESSDMSMSSNMADTICNNCGENEYDD